MICLYITICDDTPLKDASLDKETSTNSVPVSQDMIQVVFQGVMKMMKQQHNFNFSVVNFVVQIFAKV